jgi:transglutaminase-like putative cysteine protease
VPSRDALRIPPERPGLLPLTLGVFVALIAAMLPLLRVVSLGPWSAGVLLVAVAVLGAGYTARRFRLPAVAVSLIEIGVWLLLVTLIFLRSTAIFGIIPGVASVKQGIGMVDNAVQEIILGAAPLTASTSLSFCIVGATGALAIIVDHVVLTARMPLLAAVGLVAVSLIPSMAVSSAFDVAGFAVLSAAILFLIRTETRTRSEAGVAAGVDDARSGSTRSLASRPLRGAAFARPSARSDRGTPTSTSAAAIGIGAIAVVVAVVAAPLLPTSMGSIGMGGTVSINASLNLGTDLRSPADIQVLTYTTTSPSAPYLRVATLSSFNGALWLPDQGQKRPVNGYAGLDELEPAPGVYINHYTTDITVQNLTSEYAPVPYAAVSVDGLGPLWSVMPSNRTVLSATTTTGPGLSYEVHSEVPVPTLEQIRASTAHLGHASPYDNSLPSRTPAIIAQTAAQVTAGTNTDYDALIALQDYFRGDQFTYSLTAPVKQGYDGSGAAAVAEFLKVKKGYCIHFASAFALMARSLGMASRIVVGYLPGDAVTNAQQQTTYSVTSTELHAWPEVYFEGVGWVPFEPTKSLGSASGFSSADSGDSSGSASSSPSPSASASAGGAANSRGLRLDDSHTGADTQAANPVPWAFGALGVLLLLSVPAIIGTVRRRRQDAAAREGDVQVAWAGILDTAIDVGVPLPPSESPRALGSRLVRDHGVPPREMGILVGAVERASYARDGVQWYMQEERIADASAAVRVALLKSVSSSRRMLALLFPRSLVIRPGSAYAGTSDDLRYRIRAR